MKKILCLIPILFVVFLLTSCSPIDQQDFYDAILPNVWVVLANLISAIVLISLMTWLIYKPTNKYLERRREYISNEILNAEEKNKMISDEIEKLMEEKRLVKMESSKIIDDAKNLGNEEKSKLINEGKKQAMIVFENAKKHVESVKEKNIKKNNEEIVLLATKISQGILKKKFTKKENNKLFSEIEQKMKDIKPIS